MPPQRKKIKTANENDSHLHVTNPTLHPDLVAQSLEPQMDSVAIHPDLASSSTHIPINQPDAAFAAGASGVLSPPVKKSKQRVRKNTTAAGRLAANGAAAAEPQQQHLHQQSEPEEAAVSLDAAAEFLRTIQEQESQKNLLALAAQQDTAPIDGSGLPTDLSALQFPLHNTQTSFEGFVSATDFQAMVDEYLTSLSVKKQTKALLSQQMYDDILHVLLHPAEAKVGSAQFRFWAKKMFKLISTQVAHIVIHENKPVAVKEQLYEVLVQCHGQANHGGRDKTAAQVYSFFSFYLVQVRKFYSWVPKELIARFVKGCPTCRNASSK